MFRDEKTETQHKRLPDDEPAVPAEPATSGESAVPEYLEGVRQPHPQEPRPQEPRPQEPRREELPLLRPGTMKPQSAPRPLQISNGTRRVPTYPAWEKPPSAFEYPRLRSQEVHRPVKPLAIAAVGMVLIAAVVLAFTAQSPMPADRTSPRRASRAARATAPTAPVVCGRHRRRRPPPARAPPGRRSASSSTRSWPESRPRRSRSNSTSRPGNFWPPTRSSRRRTTRSRWARGSTSRCRARWCRPRRRRCPLPPQPQRQPRPQPPKTQPQRQRQRRRQLRLQL